MSVRLLSGRSESNDAEIHIRNANDKLVTHKLWHHITGEPLHYEEVAGYVSPEDVYKAFTFLSTKTEQEITYLVEAYQDDVDDVESDDEDIVC